MGVLRYPLQLMDRVRGKRDVDERAPSVPHLRGSGAASPSTTPSASPPPLPGSGLGLVAQHAGGTAPGG